MPRSRPPFRRPGLLRRALPLALLILLGLPTALGLSRTAAAADFGTLALGWEGIVPQSLPNTCGPAVIATLLLGNGQHLDDLAVASHAELRPDGLTLAEFAALATRFGFQGEWFSWPRTPRLPSLPIPSVVHLEDAFGHFALLHAVTADTVVLADPARGNLLMTHDAFLAEWTGAAYTPFLQEGALTKGGW